MSYEVIVTPTIYNVEVEINEQVISPFNINVEVNQNVLPFEVDIIVGGQDLILTTTGNSGASTYNEETGALNIPNYSLSGLGGVPTTRTLTINGTSQDLSANRSFTIPTHDAVTLGTANGLSLSGQQLSLGLASASSVGSLNSADWSTFNGKQNALSLTVVGSSGSATLIGSTLNIPSYSLTGLGGVPTTRTITINGVTQDLSENISFTVSGGGGSSITIGTPANGLSLSVSNVLSLALASTSTTGALSSTDWNTFNSKQSALSLTTSGSSGSSTLVGSTLNIPTYTLTGLGGVPTSRTITINGTAQDLSSNRSWTVGDVRTDSSYADPAWITSLSWSKITNRATTLSGYGITDAVNKGGDTMTGFLTLNADPSNALHAATKAYVDSVSEGLHIHPSARVATSGNVNLSTDLEPGDVVDGVTLAQGDRVLVKSQSLPAQNGIYVVQASGAAVRAADFNEPAEVDGGDFVFVNSGTLYADTGWVQVTDNVTIIGTDPIIFTQFSGAGTYLAGTGLTLTGNIFSANIGTDIQAYDADLASIAGLAGTSGYLIKTGAGSWTLDTSTHYSRIISVITTNTVATFNSGVDYVYLASNTISVTLPTAVANQSIYTVKNKGTGVITINTTSSQTIDGSVSITLPVQYEAVSLVSDGSNWNII